MADFVQLTDLDVITRYSIAVRSASADRDELISTLRADLAWLERGARGRATYAAPAEADGDGHEEAGEAPARRAPARRTASARKTAAKKTTTRRAR